MSKLVYDVIGAAMEVYNELGPGLLESVYEKALMCELKEREIKAESQKQIEITYKGVVIGNDLRLDILVEDQLIVELKSVEGLQPIHFKQLRTYMRLLDKPIGLLINFDVSDFARGYKVLYKDR